MTLFKAIIFRFIAYQLPYLLLKQDQSQQQQFLHKKS